MIFKYGTEVPEQHVHGAKIAIRLSTFCVAGPKTLEPYKRLQSATVYDKLHQPQMHLRGGLCTLASCTHILIVVLTSLPVQQL